MLAIRIRSLMAAATAAATVFTACSFLMMEPREVMAQAAGVGAHCPPPAGAAGNCTPIQTRRPGPFSYIPGEVDYGPLIRSRTVNVQAICKYFPSTQPCPNPGKITLTHSKEYEIQWNIGFGVSWGGQVGLAAGLVGLIHGDTSFVGGASGSHTYAQSLSVEMPLLLCDHTEFREWYQQISISGTAREWQAETDYECQRGFLGWWDLYTVRCNLRTSLGSAVKNTNLHFTRVDTKCCDLLDAQPPCCGCEVQS